MSLISELQGLLPTTADIAFGELPLWPDDSDLMDEAVPDMGLAEEPIAEYALDMGIE